MKHLKDLGPGTTFDHVTALLRDVFDAPFALASFIRDEVTVFRSDLQFDARPVSRQASVSRILVEMGPGAELFIEDGSTHPVLKDHPMVTGAPFLRFFAGVTVSNVKGEPVGCVGIMDSKPRPALAADGFATLHQIAAIASVMWDQLLGQRVHEEELALLRLGEDMSGVGIWRFDLRSGEVVWSPETWRIHGYAPGEIVPDFERVLASYHPDDAPLLEAAVARAIATGEGYALRLRLRRPDGEERLVETKAGTQQDESGQTVRVFGVFQDVTDAVRSQEKLVESEALLRAMNETATDLIARYALDGTFLYLSPSVETILGYRPDEMVGRKCGDFIPAEDVAVMEALSAAYVEAGPGATPLRHEFRAIRADGTTVWLEATPRAVWNETGCKVVEIHDHVRDITARKAAERVQLELVQTLGMAGAMTGIGSWRLDVATGKPSWSDEVYRIHGKSRETFDPGLDDAVGCYHPDDRPAVQAWIGQAIETGEAHELQLRLIRDDGQERIVTSRCHPVRDETGTTTALFGVFQDVTEQVLAQRRIEASEARYRLLADHASDIILTYGVDGRIRYISPSVEAVTGMAPDALIGEPVTALIHPQDIPRLTGAFRDLVRSEGATGRDGLRYRGNLASGETRWFEARTTLIRDNAGRVIEFHDVVRDVTATKALEDELIAARDVAEAGARAKSEFLANMSHELRTPLTSVIGFAGLLQGSAALPDAERRYADRIATSSDALLSVINDILDYSKLEAEAVDLDPLAFDPAAMARSAAAIVEAQCQDKGLLLRVETSARLPRTVMADEGRLRQVTLNFLSNAVKFTASGEILLSVQETGTNLRVSVTDSGIGIAPEKIEAIFERFTQADTSTTRVYGGTGLGLSICRRLIELMGGTIGAESRGGEGSTFWFEVPLVAADTPETAAPAVAASLPADLRVLIADDAPANRELVRLLLEALDIQLDTVCDGAEAVQAAAAGTYDLILMDVHMPVMDGLAATRAIRVLQGPVAATPILALTANVQPEQIETCRVAGMDGHVGKPIQIATLVEAMARALDFQTRPARKNAA